jgi:hypothetical protein
MSCSNNGITVNIESVRVERVSTVENCGCSGDDSESGGGYAPPTITLPSIRTNDVKIQGVDDTTVTSVAFTLKDFMVTAGQPYNLEVGKTDTGTNTLTINICRHNSPEVRAWAYEVASDSKEHWTGDYGGKNANFALLGDLTIGYKKKGQPRSATFHNVVLMQYHDVFDNPWALGGRELNKLYGTIYLYETDQRYIYKASSGSSYIFNFFDGN